MKIQDVDNLYDLQETGLKLLLPDEPVIGVGMGTCGIGNGADVLYQAFLDEVERRRVRISVRPVGCFGFCAAEPLVNVRLPGRPLVVLHRVQLEQVPDIVKAISANEIPMDLALCKIESWDHLTRQISYGEDYPELLDWQEVPFFKGQQKIVLRNCGLINPEDILEYIAIGGYFALHGALQKPRQTDVIDELKRAKLRGRGGAGYPAGIKWNLLRKAEGERKYLVCNADEGDPGAYMNRNEIESDPHMLIEGMLIGAYATGATHGIIYLRAEYPLAVERLRKAIEEAHAHGLLGEGILGTDMAFEIQLVEGAGAFVCGEETAMIASLEGKAGRPRPRPPYPAQKGLWGYPTNINNVETWCNVPVILARGGDWFASIGTPDSSGTKVFSLVGKIRNTGLAEMPLGTPLRHILYEVGQGGSGEKPIKAIQTGGPSGGCIPAKHFDTPVDYESLAKLGAIMGSGGMVVMDEDTCMVDVARYFIEFSHSESCGKCVPCRAGLDQMLRIMNRVTSGESSLSELTKLEDLARMIKEASLCGLGQTAPNPVLTTLRYFRDEYEEHIREHRCRAGICEEMQLAPCENSCPLHMRIPSFLQLIKEDRFMDAAEMIWRDNPLPASTGRVCQHPCEDRCRRGTLDEPINMRDVHRYVADELMEKDTLDEVVERLLSGRPEASGKQIAVIGGGPAGLSAAFYLALLGHGVTVYEGKAAAGGMLRYSLPEYRLPKAILDKEIGVLERLGVTFEYNKRMGEEVSFPQLEKAFDAVFLSLGTWRETEAQLEGEDAKGVWPAIDFLETVAVGKKPKVKRTVVIGGGNAAIDASRTALRLGSDVQVVYRRERRDMPAIQEEVDDALAEGVELTFFAAPKRILTDANNKVVGVECDRMEAGTYDSSGRRRPVATGETMVIECDSVIMAIGEVPDTTCVSNDGLTLGRQGKIVVDAATLRTDRPHAFAGGDVVNGASNVTIAMGSGKKAAGAIDKLLMGEDRMAQALKTFVHGMESPPNPDPAGRQAAKHVAAEKRRSNFVEVMKAITAKEAHCEALRCLRCDVKDVCTTAQPSEEEATV